MSLSLPIKRPSVRPSSGSERIGTATMVVLGLAAMAHGAAHLAWWANSKIKGES
jgi:hypothetical protein